MKSSSSTSSILRLHDKNNEQGGEGGGASSPNKVLRRSSSSSVTVLHQKQLPSYSAERFYILSELQLHSVSPTFLVENHHPVMIDDNTTAVTVESLEGSHEASTPSQLLPLQPFSILYLVWKPEFDSATCADAVTDFGNQVIVPAVHKVQGITQIRRPSLGQSSSSSSLSRCESDDDETNEGDTASYTFSPQAEQPDACTRLYLVVEQVNSHSDNDTSANQPRHAHFEKLERYATELSRWVSTELRGLVQGVSIGVSNQERAAPGLEACMNALLVGSQDRRRHGNSSTEEGSKSLIGLIAESYADLVGPEEVQHHHDHAHHLSPVPPRTKLQQCIVTAEWSAAGDLMTFAQRAHAVWRDQHHLPPLSSRVTSRKKTVRRVAPRTMELTPEQKLADILYHSSVIAVLIFYFIFHYRHDAADIIAYFS